MFRFLSAASARQYKLITYTTMSANLMIREIGISLFLACVGLGAGDGFVETIIHEGGYVWIAYGMIITVVPLLLGRFYRTLCFQAELLYVDRGVGRFHNESTGVGLLQ